MDKEERLQWETETQEKTDCSYKQAVSFSPTYKKLNTNYEAGKKRGGGGVGGVRNDQLTQALPT